MACVTPLHQTGWTALTWATKGDWIELLLRHKADPTLQNEVTRGEDWEVVVYGGRS